ncbi:hypothetical protein [Caldichromatium japonicum]|uniref:hypothetical protein n=1 Tax=Caldichromatium japonicum TaxID=2699430 RepID=UPI003CCD758D
MAIIVDRDNPLERITKSQLVELYSGRIDNWRALGGPDLLVVRVSKEVGRSTLPGCKARTAHRATPRVSVKTPMSSARTWKP